MKRFTIDKGMFNLNERECEILYDKFHYAYEDDEIDIKECEIENLKVRLFTPTPVGDLSLEVAKHLTPEELEDMKWLILAYERGNL